MDMQCMSESKVVFQAHQGNRQHSLFQTSTQNTLF